jgi:hypothetical protein
MLEAAAAAMASVGKTKGLRSVAWRVVARKIGRAGGLRQRTARQKEWDATYGEDQWCVGYLVDGAFVPQEDAISSVYYRSYEKHFEDHPEDLQELMRLAKKLRNPHAEATTGVDLQVPAIMHYLASNNLNLQGEEVVDIGTWDGQRSHPISVRLSPLQVRCVADPRKTLEQWWQEKKCLAVWEDD